MQKGPAAKRIFTVFMPPQSPRQPVLTTDPALLQAWVLGAFKQGQPTLGPTGYGERGQNFSWRQALKCASRLRTY